MSYISPNRGTAIYRERHVRIIVAGAGPSGLLLAYKLQRSFRKFTLIVLEKSPDIAGLWGQSLYPGCASNLPSSNLAYSFEPKSEPRPGYASAEETREYFASFAAKHGLLKYVKLNHCVLSAHWDEDQGRWEVKANRAEPHECATFWCEIFIDASGYLRCPKYLSDDRSIRGFQGVLVHSASWKQDVELRGQNVALIGFGASGVQILPAIQPIVKHVTFFARSQSSLLPPINDDVGKEEVHDYSTEASGERARLTRATNESTINSYYSLYFRGCPAQSQALSHYNRAVQAQLPCYLQEKGLFSDAGPNRRRLVAGKDFLRALSGPNVTVVPAGVSSFLSDGCLDTDGTSHTGIDVIICATGYRSAPCAPFQVLGRDGMDLERHCQAQPRSYLGIAVDGFPNYFTLLGTYSPTANGTLLPAVEAQADYILSLVDRFQSESNMHSVAPKPDAVDDFVARWAEIMAKKPWLHRQAADEASAGEERVPFIWPGTTMHYLEAIKEIRYEDWDVRYRGNRFAFLGDGISQAEIDPQADLAWYLTREDVSPFSTRWRRREAGTRKMQD